MYNVGDKVVYGTTGVCVVSEISEKPIAGSRETQLYYTMKPIFSGCVIHTPVENGKVFIRPVITKEQAEQLVDTIPTIKAEAFHSRALRELSEHYEAAIKSHDCRDLVKVTMSIYAKKKAMEEQKRKFGAVDERYMKRAEELLFGELAVALDIDRDSVLGYINERVKQKSAAAE